MNVRFLGRRALVLGIVVVSLLVSAASARATACNIDFRLSNAVTFGALQFRVGYALANGEFVGKADAVACVNTGDADLASFQDDEATKQLNAGFVAVNGATGPAPLARCSFGGPQDPSAGDFTISVVDATDPDLQPIAANVAISSISCSSCGDANKDGRITATDALIALRTAVGSAQCALAVCDANGDGSIKASDGLLFLKAAVGIRVELHCDASGGTTTTVSSTTTTSTTTTTTVPKLLTVTRSGSGTGTVTSSPTGINCGNDCDHLYAPGTKVTLIATPGSGSKFSGWSGVCSGTGSCQTTMNANRTVTATFDTATVACPTNGPITDLRSDCSNLVYLYSGGGLAEGLATNGNRVVVAQTDGIDVLAYYGPVTDVRTFSLTHASINDGPFYPVLDAGSGGSISSDGHTLNLTLKVNGSTYTFNGATWVDTQPLMVAGTVSAAVTEMTAVSPSQSRIGESGASGFAPLIEDLRR